MKHVPIVVREDGLYVDMERLGRRLTAEDMATYPGWESDAMNVGAPDGLVPVESLPSRERMQEAQRFPHQGDDLPIELDHDPVSPEGMAQGIFEPLAPFWQRFDLDAADEEALRDTVKQLRRLLVDALEQLGVAVDIEGCEMVDVMVPPEGWHENLSEEARAAYGPPPEEKDVQLRLQLNWKQTLVLVSSLAKSGAVDVRSWGVNIHDQPLPFWGSTPPPPKPDWMRVDDEMLGEPPETID